MHAVAADGVWKYFGDYPALRGASLEVARGACVALIGRNGAGKTTLLRILASLSKPSKGTIAIDGRIGYLGHGIGVYDDLSAIENLTLFGRLAGVAEPQSGLQTPRSNKLACCG